MSPRIQQGILGQCAGGDQTHDLAFHNGLIATLFRLGRAFHLFTDGNTKPFADQRQEIAFCRMMRDTAHRDVVTVMLAAFGQRDVQRLGGGNSIVKEHLVEIAHPVEQERIRMLRLDLQILRHHGRDGVLAAHVSPRIIEGHIISPC